MPVANYVVSHIVPPPTDHALSNANSHLDCCTIVVSMVAQVEYVYDDPEESAAWLARLNSLTDQIDRSK